MTLAMAALNRPPITKRITLAMAALNRLHMLLFW